MRLGCVGWAASAASAGPRLGALLAPDRPARSGPRGRGLACRVGRRTALLSLTDRLLLVPHPGLVRTRAGGAASRARVSSRNIAICVPASVGSAPHSRDEPRRRVGMRKSSQPRRTRSRVLMWGMWVAADPVREDRVVRD